MRFGRRRRARCAVPPPTGCASLTLVGCALASGVLVLETVVASAVEVDVVVTPLLAALLEAAGNAHNTVRGRDLAGLDDDLVGVEVKNDTEDVLRRGKNRQDTRKQVSEWMMMRGGARWRLTSSVVCWFL